MRPICLGDSLTLDELGNFTLKELSLPIDELLNLIKSENRVIPVDTYEKLTNLYTGIEENCKNCSEKQTNTLSFPKLDTLATQADNLRKIVSFLYTVYTVINNNNIRNMICEFFGILKKFFNL